MIYEYNIIYQIDCIRITLFILSTSFLYCSAHLPLTTLSVVGWRRGTRRSVIVRPVAQQPLETYTGRGAVKEDRVKQQIIVTIYIVLNMEWYRVTEFNYLTYMHRTVTSNHQIPGEYYFLITTVLPHHTCVVFFIIEYVVQFNYILVKLNDCKS